MTANDGNGGVWRMDVAGSVLRSFDGAQTLEVDVATVLDLCSSGVLHSTETEFGELEASHREGISVSGIPASNAL